MNSRRIFLLIKILATIGIILALYLLWEQSSSSVVRPCTISSTINCDAIITGPVSKTLGIPTPLFGLTGYIIILLSAILRFKKVLLGTALFGLLFCLWIAYQEIFLLHVICPVCIACQLIMITIFSFAVFLLTRKVV